MNKTIGYLYLFIAIIGWGLSSTFIEFGLAYLSPIGFLAIRFVLATFIPTPIVLRNRMSTIIDLFRCKWTWVVGLSETMGLVFQYFGQQYVPAGLAALLSLLFLLIVPFLSPFFLRVGLQKSHLIAVAIALIGVLLVSSEGRIENLLSGSAIGVLFLLGAAFGYALYFVTTSRLSTIEKPGLDTISLFYVVLFIIAGFSLLPLVVIPWILGLVLFSTMIGFLAYFRFLTEISANEASDLLLLQVLVPFSVDFFLLRRFHATWVFLGSFFILVAMIIVVKISNAEKMPITIDELSRDG